VEGVPLEAMVSKQPRPVQLGPAARDLGFVGGFGGLVFDWDFETNLDGLYAAGSVLTGGANYSSAICSGRFAGRKAAEYSLGAGDPVIERAQVEKEKERVYAPVNRDNGIEWQELQFLLNKIMQKYCPEYKNEQMLNMGLDWLKDIKGNEAETVMVRNPHELQRYLECMERITTGEIVIHSSLLRESSSGPLDFKRLDYPEMDPPEWQKYITVKLEGEKIKSGELPLNYWLLPPYAPTYRENYEKHCGI
jgi:succinate dehydrogenase/fumarate reductase flavoprotein subunit